MTVVVPNVPTPVPSRTDPANFAARADAYHEALPDVVDAMNLQNAENNQISSDVTAISTSVASVAGVTSWSAATNYTVGKCVFDPINFLTYRRKVAGITATRPGLDSTNWALLTGFGDVTLTGTQTLTNKTLTAPSVSGVVVTDGTANGVLYLNASEQLVSGSGLTFGGSNLGIGTNSANARLDTVFSNASTYTSSSDSLPTPAGSEFILRNSASQSSSGSFLSLRSTNTSGTANYAYIGVVANAGLTAPNIVIGQRTGATAYSERLRIDSSGNVGIGSDAPRAKLEVFGGETWLGGSSATDDHLRVSSGSLGVVTLTANNGSGTGGTYGSFALSARNGGTTVERLRIDSSGNVGIRTSTPEVQLDVYNPSGTGGLVVKRSATMAAGPHVRLLAGAVGGYLDVTGGLVFRTSEVGGVPVEVVSITSTGTLKLAGNDSAGVQFPATQVSVANANTLDDYEEGTFVPTVIGTTTAGTGTYTAQVGRYTKVGNRVYFTISIIWTAHTGTGNIQIGSLPFTPITITNYPTALSFGASNLTYSDQVFAYVNSGLPTIAISTFSTGSALTPLAMDTAASIYVSGHYEV